MDSKHPLYSKTLWANILMFVAWALQKYLGSDLLDTDTQAAIILVINFVLRLVTGKPLSLKRAS